MLENPSQRMPQNHPPNRNHQKEYYPPMIDPSNYFPMMVPNQMHGYPGQPSQHHQGGGFPYPPYMRPQNGSHPSFENGIRPNNSQLNHPGSAPVPKAMDVYQNKLKPENIPNGIHPGNIEARTDSASEQQRKPILHPNMRQPFPYPMSNNPIVINVSVDQNQEDPQGSNFQQMMVDPRNYSFMGGHPPYMYPFFQQNMPMYDNNPSFPQYSNPNNFNYQPRPYQELNPEQMARKNEQKINFQKLPQPMFKEDQISSEKNNVLINQEQNPSPDLILKVIPLQNKVEVQEKKIINPTNEPKFDSKPLQSIIKTTQNSCVQAAITEANFEPKQEINQQPEVKITEENFTSPQIKVIVDPIQKSKFVQITGKRALVSLKRLSIRDKYKKTPQEIQQKSTFATNMVPINLIPKNLEKILIPIYSFNENNCDENENLVNREKRNPQFTTVSRLVEENKTIEFLRILRLNTKKIQLYWNKKSLNFPISWKRKYIKKPKGRFDKHHNEIIDLSNKIIQSSLNAFTGESLI